MRQAISSCFVLVGFTLIASVACAQSTITDRPFDLVAGSGVWGSLLPDYELGTNANGAPALRDKMDDVGYYGDLKAIRRFLGTRTSFETRGFYAYSESRSSSDPVDVDIPDPFSGSSNLLLGGSPNLASKTHHYGFDIGLRDTWRTRFGGLSGGCYFSYMMFDQTFDVDYGATRLMSEKLDSEYLGGKGFVGWDGCIAGQASTLDFVVGFYQLRADYRAIGDSLSGSLSGTLHKTPVTLESVFSTYRDFRGCKLGMSFSAVYIAEMAQIRHNVGAPASLDTDSAVSLRLMFELLL